ncbi:Xaa-Pro peptidase family protein [Haloarchaeobius sp. HME9146]|uniref:M24 family metallopeptidase n=1 Tax=Haloarchaeobius sp. HME9146 TaxID=2978732 RepID=UPI0021BED889|nr:Xaa-Pro peptidase family protein [Haloarchaeobius sp. HME9146]MCT9096759.1 Xaa-Pro peptidase family protein [Haloarchaeobius sp. HME9146]
MNDFERRARACQERLEAVDADAAVLFPSPNLYYASGFHEEPAERHLFLFVPETGDPVFLVPKLYASQIRDESWVSDVRTWADGDDPVEAVKTIADDLDLAGGHLLVDDTMWARFTQDLEAALPDATFGLASEVFDDLRLRKDDTELDALRRAAEVSDQASEEIRKLGGAAVGLTERELAEEIESTLAGAGGGGLAFDVIVGSGPNGAKPHHSHGDREIQRGDPVVLDFGAFVDHYPGDQTRTVVFAGDPPEGFEEVHRVVLEALEAGVAAVEPGVEAQAVDRATRRVIEDAGYGDEFIHRTGHGVGLEVHEPPYIVEGNDQVLEPGMVFSVEPGIYLDGRFGVRIEDLVVVTDDGCERLNHSPRTWESL